MILLFAQHEPLRRTIAEILRRDGVEVQQVTGELPELLRGGRRFRVAIVAYDWDPAPARRFAAQLRTACPGLPVLGIDDPEPALGAPLLRTPFAPAQLVLAMQRLLASTQHV